MERESIFDQVKTVIKEKEEASNECARVTTELEAEKQKAIKEVEKRYKKMANQAEANYSAKSAQFWDVCGKLYEAGYFVNADLVPQLAIFMSYVEGDRYIPVHSTKAQNNNIIALASEVKDNEEISSDQLEEMYNTGRAIILSEGFSPMIELYNHAGEPYSLLGYYNYIREFIEGLVEYRVRNNLKWYDMKADGITRFMAGYLFAHPQLVSLHKDKRETMLSGEQDECTFGCAKLEKLRNGQIAE